MEIWEFILDNWLIILSAIITAISIIYSLFGAIKTGNANGVVKLIAQIPILVATAEKLFGGGNGIAKLNYVLTELRVFALENKINVSTDYLTQQINSVVDTTNSVNVNKGIASNKIQPSISITNDAVETFGVVRTDAVIDKTNNLNI